MARRVITAVQRVLRPHEAYAEPHFHQSAHGAAVPAVCDDVHCPFPRLTIG